MIPIIPMVILTASAMVLAILVLVLRKSPYFKAGVPTPIACLVVGVVLLGGVSYVVSTTRQDTKHREISKEAAEPPPAMLKLAQGMMQMGKGGGPGMFRDTKSPLVALVEKLALNIRNTSFELAASQRALMKPILEELASAQELALTDASIKEQALRGVLTEEQAAVIHATVLEQTGSPVNYSADLTGNPFKQGKPKESLDALLAFLGESNG